ncbi:MAG: tetratricopeptide repeat protein, partial [Terriglobia bacterium]
MTYEPKRYLITGLIFVVLVAIVVGPRNFKSGAQSLQSDASSLPSGEGAWVLKIATVDGRFVPSLRLNRRLIITSQGDTDGLSIYSCKPKLSAEELRTIAQTISSATPSAWSAWSDVHITDSCITRVSLSRREADGKERTYNASWLCPAAHPPNMPADLAAVYGSANRLRDDVIKRCKDEYEQGVESLRREIQTKPDDAGTHERLGDLYSTGFRYEEAVEAYKQLVRLKPTDVDALSKLADAYRRSDHDNEAIETYK